jgi:transposase
MAVVLAYSRKDIPLKNGPVTEEEAREFFLRYRWRNHRKACPRCGRREVREIRRHRLYCPDCHYEFGDFTRTYLARVNIGFKAWLELLQCFLLEWPARQAAQELDLSYPTVSRGFHLIRMAIAAQDQDPTSNKGEGGNGASGTGGSQGQAGRGPQVMGPVCGVQERAGRVRVEVLPAFPVEELAGLKVRQMGRSHIGYTSKFKAYDCLMLCLPAKPGVDLSPVSGIITRRINSPPGFRGYARARFVKLRGISREKFPFYLQELAFRYNHPEMANSFTILASYLTQPLAKPL